MSQLPDTIKEAEAALAAVDIPGGTMVAVVSGDTGERLHDSISLRAFLGILGAGEHLDEAAAFYEERLHITGGIEIDTPRGIFGVFVKGRTCPCCGRTS